ncbi:MAG: multidrug efflux MFS transporter [Nocardioides sp.]|nr:multidrug efflux MFS transporter [Nocardioides sp.]
MTESEAPTAPASGRLDRGVIITGLVVVSGLIMVILDTTIVNVALNTLGSDLDSPLSTTQWVVTGYMLAVGTVIPVSGWALDRFGTKRVWLFSLTMFVIGSALCAFAWSMPVLIVFRIIQGLGGGMLMPTGQTIITRAAGPDRMGRMMAVLGIPMLLGPVFGPVIGGVLVEYTSWEWIFLVNVPVGALAIVLAVRLLGPGDEHAHTDRLDLRGLVLLAGGLVALLYGLSRASAQASFAKTDVIAWLVGGGVLIALFVVSSLLRAERSVIDVRLFRNRLFAGGSVTIFLVGIGLFGGMLMLPLYYQSVRLEGAAAAGLLLAPQGLGAAVAMPIAGRITDRFGAGWVVPVGVVLAVLGTIAFTQVGTDTSYVWLSAALFVRGLGLGGTMMPTIAASYSQLTPKLVSRAAPTISAIQQVGGALGGALLVVVLTETMNDKLASAGLPAGGGGGNVTSVPPAMHDRLAPLLASSFGEAFWTAAILIAVIIVPAVLLPRRPAAAAG